MSKGNSYSDVAVYLPTEDAWIKGIMPEEQQFIWAHEFYEMRYIYFPGELAGHHPIWINQEFLRKAKWEDGLLSVGDAAFSSLYVDAMYLDVAVLKRIIALAREGLPLTMKQIPAQAGSIQDAEWDPLLDELQKLSNVSMEFEAQSAPLVQAKNMPAYWARETEQSLYLFFAHPQCRQIKFPMEYGQSFSEKTRYLPVVITYQGERYEVELIFPPNQSLMYEISGGQIKQLDISLQTKTPEIRERPADFVAPWLVN
jgi:hypothetical protein